MSSIPWIIFACLLFWGVIAKHKAGKDYDVQLEVMLIEVLLLIIIAYLAAILGQLGKTK